MTKEESKRIHDFFSQLGKRGGEKSWEVRKKKLLEKAKKARKVPQKNA